MRRVKFDTRYGQHEAVITGKKKQFRIVEKSLVEYLENNFPSQNIVSTKPFAKSNAEVVVTLDVGVNFNYQTEYQLGEVLIVSDTRGKVKIKITGIEIQRLCNASAKQVINEGFSVEKIDGYHQYCYHDNEEDVPCQYRSHEQCLISYLYRTMEQMTVLNNPYAVVYEFEKVESL